MADDHPTLLRRARVYPWFDETSRVRSIASRLPDGLRPWTIARFYYPGRASAGKARVLLRFLKSQVAAGRLILTMRERYHRDSYFRICPSIRLQYPEFDDYLAWLKEQAKRPPLISSMHRYEVIERANWRGFLDAAKQSGVSLPEPPEIMCRWAFPAEPAEPVAREDGAGKPAGRRERQIRAIMGAIEAEGFSPLDIPPKDGKERIRRRCLEDTQLFTARGFRHAWREASKRKLIDGENFKRARQLRLAT